MRRLVVTCCAVAVLLTGALAVADEGASFKGWELYSWQDQGWSFALVRGTNRQKQWDEIARARVRGLADAKKKLAALKKGEQVTWSAGAGGALAGPVPVALALPPDSIVQDLAAECARLGVALTVPSPVTAAVTNLDGMRESVPSLVATIAFTNPSAQACRVLRYTLVWPAGRKDVGNRALPVGAGATMTRRLKVETRDGDLAKLDRAAARVEVIAACR
ncbi:MAG TPA: hypothetical protein VGQ83_27530 [Polyangia bacterium]|jgi:hypothetical protein